MTINFCTPKELDPEILKTLESDFGFEIILDYQEDGLWNYFLGYDNDSEDPLEYDEAVRCCGVLSREGISEFAIEGNGGWAMGMIQSTDFSRYAVSDDVKQAWANRAAIFWKEADPKKLSEIIPKPKGDRP